METRSERLARLKRQWHVNGRGVHYKRRKPLGHRRNPEPLPLDDSAIPQISPRRPDVSTLFRADNLHFTREQVGSALLAGIDDSTGDNVASPDRTATLAKVTPTLTVRESLMGDKHLAFCVESSAAVCAVLWSDGIAGPNVSPKRYRAVFANVQGGAERTVWTELAPATLIEPHAVVNPQAAVEVAPVPCPLSPDIDWSAIPPLRRSQLARRLSPVPCPPVPYEIAPAMHEGYFRGIARVIDSALASVDLAQPESPLPRPLATLAIPQADWSAADDHEARHWSVWEVFDDHAALVRRDCTWKESAKMVR